MSGRSAYVRAQKEKQADKHYLKQRYGDETWQEEHFGEPDTKDAQDFRRLSVESIPSGLQPHPLSVAPTVYGYQQRHNAQPYMYKSRAARQQLRPIVIASAIEKSDFRTHLDGLTDSVRGKLGRIMGIRDKPPTRSESKASYRRSSVTMSPPPSLNAVPSLIPSLPSPAKALPFARPSSGTQGRPGSHEGSFLAIGVFQGGGKTFTHDWKSHLAVRATRASHETLLTK